MVSDGDLIEQTSWKTPPAYTNKSMLPPSSRNTTTAIWEALALLHHFASLAESLHGWLRPYLSIHPGMSDWLLPLWQFYWNHHVFSRGKNPGQNPLQLTGIDDALIDKRLR